MIASLPCPIGSMCALAWTRTRPRPVAYASRIPSRPRIVPAVGKSGPLMWRISPSTSIVGSSMYAIVALITSRRLWGGMLVAIPTAIPEPPLTSRFGKRDGSASGSWRVPS